MKVVAITQARMTSNRLPGKVLRTVLEKPLLEYHLERVLRSRLADQVVTATTTNDADEPIVELCRRLGVPCFRGPEDDVLARYHAAASAHGADAVVRVTSDCPLIDPAVIDRTIAAFVDNLGRVDYVSNRLAPSYPRGMDTEVFSFAALDEAQAGARKLVEREHVTPFIWMRPKRYRLMNVAYGHDESRHRWTVDTPEDFELIRRILEAIYPTNPEFTLADCLALVAQHPDWQALNRHVRQKEVV